MSFFVILALLVCFDVQGSYPEHDDLHPTEGWSLDVFTVYYPEIEEDDQISGDEQLEDPWEWSVNLTVDSVSSSAASCKLSVTCSTLYFDIHSTFTCDTKTCYQDGGEQRKTSEGADVSLHVYLSDGSIICNYSNQVTWTKDMTEIGRFCPQNAESLTCKSLSDGVFICTVKTVVFSVGLIIMVSAVISVHVIEKRSKTKQTVEI